MSTTHNPQTLPGFRCAMRPRVLRRGKTKGRRIVLPRTIAEQIAARAGGGI